MKLTIIETGAVPGPLQSQYGSYPEMFRRMFANAAPGEFSFDTVTVEDGIALPDPETLEGVAITGSPAGVHDDLRWIEPLRAFIQKAHAAGVPMVGICFGHQIMADALGGQVARAPGGWGIGRHDYTRTSTSSVLDPLPKLVQVACSHQDQVVEAPPEAQTILASPFTPHAGLVYNNGRAMSLQPHPEFSDDYALALVDLRKEQVPAATLDAAKASFAQASHSDAVAEVLARFLLSAHEGRKPK
ncbi:glutamine amidotransferase [Devosia pacifica]|uniref:Glutamine amidotransferase n=1 Tax=Devosia pacifica TaxID=1335967 RepID=A0A918VXE0_9HYPH|nr:type 1 glutamine amidotransferase [Devosia pacifica]GHA32491.1 glutamine amidotransferase [Devosia pacifica]